MASRAAEQLPPPPRWRDQSPGSPAVLADGTAVWIRPVRPTDQELVRGVFRELSATSRTRRFFTYKTDLSPADLRYLTVIDGVRHFALGALTRDGLGRHRGIGDARFVTLDGTVAEPALMVVDAMQRKGLGRQLARRLAQAAYERGIARFHVEYLATNGPVRSLLAALGQADESLDEYGVVSTEIPVARVLAMSSTSAHGSTRSIDDDLG